jgi:streptogrisin D
MGSTTGLHDGTVTGLDATVNFQSETDPNGVDTVNGLIQTDVCAEAGDSGGSLFTQDGGAVGLTSGGSGDCTAGGETFFQPVTAALTATGATLGDAGAGAGAGAGDTATADPSATAADPSATDGTGDQSGAVDPSATDGTGDQSGVVDPSATDGTGTGVDQSGNGQNTGTGADDGSSLTSNH